MQFSFGSGVMSAVRTDLAGIATPMQFGALQEGSIEFSASIKELFGQYKYPLAIAGGTGKISGKAKFASVNGKMLNELFFNGSLATGQSLVSWGEAGTVPGVSTYTVTVVNSAVWVENLSVVNGTTGVEMVQVASAPATGQYSVAAGVYTFAAADANTPVLISYRYTAVTGQQLTITNQLLGTQPMFQLTFNRRYNGNQTTIRLLQCTSNKLGLSGKLEDFDIPEFEFSAMANAAGILGYISFAQ